DSVPASLDRAVCVVCARSGARASSAAIATAHAIVLVPIVRIHISCSRLFSDGSVVRPAAHPDFIKARRRTRGRASLYDGETTFPQLHNDHNDIDRRAR